MISVQEVVADPDMIAPEPFTILRSTGAWVLGGFQSTVTRIPQMGPVQQASNKELRMLPEADRVGAVRSFWCTVPLLLVRGYAPVPGVHVETPQGSGVSYTISVAPPGGVLDLFVNGLLQMLDTDYTINGNVITLITDPGPDATIYCNWPIPAYVGAANSDIIEYEGDPYRLVSVFRVPGSGYWKALGQRLRAA